MIFGQKSAQNSIFQPKFCIKCSKTEVRISRYASDTSDTQPALFLLIGWCLRFNQSKPKQFIKDRMCIVYDFLFLCVGSSHNNHTRHIPWFAEVAVNVGIQVDLARFYSNFRYTQHSSNIVTRSKYYWFWFAIPPYRVPSLATLVEWWRTSVPPSCKGKSKVLL